MEKSKAHYSLARMKTLLKAGRYRITTIARKTSLEDFSMLENEIIDAVLTLDAPDFYKSMTTHHDSKLWQDVYHKVIINRTAYIKLQIYDDDTIIISFKEK